MKILSGKLRGRNFYMPAHIRPTNNMTRKAVFDLIGHDLKGLDFLDLFAGSGAVGLEAISLGAQKVTLVEKDIKCLKVIDKNLDILGLKSTSYEARTCEVFRCDAFQTIKMLSKLGRKFDVVFVDPPYNKGLAKKALKTLCGYDILQPNCLIIVEYGKWEGKLSPDERFFPVTQRKYGLANIDIYKYEK